jgi:SRSO17 transposase
MSNVGAKAVIPEQVGFATKPQLAVQILAELHTAGRLPGWVTGDEVYGNNPSPRRWCKTHQVGYVLGVPCSFMVTLGCGTRRRWHPDKDQPHSRQPQRPHLTSPAGGGDPTGTRKTRPSPTTPGG